MFSKAIIAALIQRAAARIRYFEKQIEFYQKKEANPQLEELANQLCKGRFYLLKVEETRCIVISQLRKKINLLSRRMKEGYVLHSFVCQKCRKRIIPATRLIIEPDCTCCEVCNSVEERKSQERNI